MPIALTAHRQVGFGLPLALSMLAALVGCREPTPPAPATAPQASSLPRLAIKADRKLLFTYFAAAQGAFASTTRLADVPVASRDWVRVVDLALRPGQRQDHQLVYVADLRAARADASYPYVVLPRATFEQLAPRRALGGAEATGTPTTGSAATGTPAPGKPPSKPRVVLYATSWCPACRAARAWLTAHGVAFVERDIERDPAASAELMTKAQRQGISPSGVPVLDVGGTLIEGFDAARITALLGGRLT
ncbi:MAG: hypothetical protein IPL40_04565 [Proteobacteria bacterium]|nr:hypothetical protein [Pseudomonadota bacterium]